ncbi:MAG: DUF4349 domain-containing protein, partial [Phycisphaeraceae bacterium]|nr:DUF4349 domain-containing protein [Phycisphaeraceae bacterium]
MEAQTTRVALADEPAVNRPVADPAAAKRIMVYTAAVHMVVLDRDSARTAVRRTAEELGGFMQKLSDASITIKVPAPKFQQALSALETLGQVGRRDIRGRDVTEQYRDLQVRIENAEQTRQRLTALLDKAKKVSEALEIEKELHRITEELERLKGKLRFLSESVAFSTIVVHLNAPVRKRELVAVVPFQWVRSLGAGFSQRPDQAEDRTGWFNPPLGVTLPEAYISYHRDGDQTRAMSADQVQINLRRHKNYQGGNLTFWSKLARRALTDGQALVLAEEDQSIQAGGREATVITGQKKIGRKTFGYLIGLVRTDSYIYSFEAWGPAEAFDGDREKLIDSFKSLRPSIW